MAEKFSNEISFIPEGPIQGTSKRKSWNILWFLKGPVVGGEGSCQGHLPQGNHKVGEPEEHEQEIDF